MSFRSIVRDVRDSIGSLSRRSFDVWLPGHLSRKSHDYDVHELQDPPIVIQNSRWANLAPELLCDIIKRLEASESTWPARKHVVACAAVCRSWREMCLDIVQCPQFCGKLTFPVSLKQPGPQDGSIQCFIKRDKYNLTYHLFLCTSPALLAENGKFLLSAKRTRRTTYTEYVISMNVGHISRSSSTYIGKVRSNFLGTKFIIFDTQPPGNRSQLTQTGQTSRRFYSKKVSPKIPRGSYNIAEVSYELNVLGTRGPRKMNVMMHSIPCSFEDSFRSMSFSKSIYNSSEFSSARFSDILASPPDDNNRTKDRPLVLQNKAPRWHEQLQCWCLNFKGRVTVASVKNFQLIAAAATATTVSDGPPASQSSSGQSDHDKVILQFGKNGETSRVFIGVFFSFFTQDCIYPNKENNISLFPFLFFVGVFFYQEGIS